MDDNSARFIDQLRKNPALLQKLLHTPDGQTLMHLLGQGDQGARLRSAVKDASKGRPEEAVRLVSQFMQTPDGAALAQRIQHMFGN